MYDAAGQLLKVQKAFSTSLQQDYATYTYTLNGKQASVKDANGNLASMTYDGHDRQTRWTFPSKTSIGSVDASDYEEYAYDANGNRTSLRKRDGSVLSYQYDALNRNTVKVVPERSGLPSSIRYHPWRLLICPEASGKRGWFDHDTHSRCRQQMASPKRRL